jgi:hypothetical protein
VNLGWGFVSEYAEDGNSYVLRLLIRNGTFNFTVGSVSGLEWVIGTWTHAVLDSVREQLQSHPQKSIVDISIEMSGSGWAEEGLLVSASINR